MIPLIDLQAQYQSIKEDINIAISGILSEGDFIRGKSVKNFEKAFADYLGSMFCLGVGNGTDALEIILKSLDIGPGDEVIVPSLTWIATAESVNNVGAEPVFVDIDPVTYTIDINKIKSKISKKTKAIIAVHLYGCPAKLDDLLKIANEHSIKVIEDCAQAHGAEFLNKKVGTFGVASSFSFFPSKNLGAYGDAGAIVTDDPDIYERACKIANHGQLKIKNEHNIIGRNSRLDTIQAAVLLVKLKYLDEWNTRRIAAASYYRSSLRHCSGIILPTLVSGSKHVFHLFVIRSEIRDQLIKALDEHKISWAIHYPTPLPLTPAYGYRISDNSEFSVSQSISGEIISLPIYPEIKKEQIDFICETIMRIY